MGFNSQLVKYYPSLIILRHLSDTEAYVFIILTYLLWAGMSMFTISQKYLYAVIVTISNEISSLGQDLILRHY